MKRTQPESRIHGIPQAALSLLVGAAVVVSACSKAEAPRAEVVRPVRAIQVPDPAPAVLPAYTGRARAAERSKLAFEVDGRILERRVDVGDRVEKGQLLASLDPRDFQQALRAARAQAKEARAYRDRVAEARTFRAVSEQDLTDAENQLQAAEATLRIRKKALEDSELLAPHAGEVSAVYAETFQVVRPKQPVVRLLDASRLEMVIDLPENRIALAQYVKDVRVRFDAFPDLEIRAVISEIGQEASATTRTYPVTLSMDQPEGVRIQPGMTGRASARPELPEGASPPILVPASAILADGGKHHVWVLDPQQKLATRRAVTPAEATTRGVPIESGLEVGEWVAISGARSLKQGQKIEILDVIENPLRLPMPDDRGIPAGDVTVSSLEQ